MSSIRTAMLGALLMGLCSVLAQAQDKPAEKGKSRGDGDASSLAQAGDVVGRLTKIGSGGSFTLQVVQNTVQGTRTVRLPRTTPRGPQPVQRVPNVRQVPKDYTLQASDDVIVRVMEKPLKFDDKGKPIPYTAEELKELKGDPNLPGYQSDFESLKPGQIVRVHFGRVATTTKPKDKEDIDKEKDKPKEKPGATSNTDVGMIIVLAAGKAPPEKPTEMKDKKK